MQFEFTLGIPFKPFEQLMGVLPEASKEHIPPAYRVRLPSLTYAPYHLPYFTQELMCDSESPIIDFYPQEFVQDLNGKKQEWEAIVKIPFITEDRLLKAMAGAN
jgi:5'-3' exoribonuclease 1